MARPDEEDAALTLVYTPPGAEAIGLLGGENRALAFGRGLKELGMYRVEGDQLLIAVQGRRTLGMLLAHGGDGGMFTWSRVAGLVGLSLRTFPLRELPGFLARSRLRLRLDFPIPRPTLHIAEVHVDPASRGRGIGGLLLEAAERTAREGGLPQLSLTTLITNPARRLYRRHGFETAGKRTVEGYEALTGAPGRVMMVKALVSEPSSFDEGAN